MPREKITIPGYGRFVEALLDELGVEQRRGRRQLDGRLHRLELAIRFPQRVERLVLVSAAGLSIEYLRNERALSVALRRSTPASRPTAAGWPRGRTRSRAGRARGG